MPLGLSQHVTGIGITLLATSLTYYIYRLVLPEVTSPPKIEPFQPWPIPGLSDIPFLGEALFRQTPLTYLAFIARRASSPGSSIGRRPALRSAPPARTRPPSRRRASMSRWCASLPWPRAAR